MRTRTWTMFVIAAAASGCPYDVEEAGVTPGDGGVWVGEPDARVFLQTDDLSVRPTRVLPNMKTLCMLYPGDLNDNNDYPLTQGIWIEDIINPSFLGPPSEDADYRAVDSAQLRYTYQKPGSALPEGAELVSLSLSFEKVVVVDAQGAKLWGDGKAMNGQPWPQPYFLNGISVQGMNSLECWDPFLRTSSAYHYTLCPWCASLGEQFIQCKQERAEDCFR